MDRTGAGLSAGANLVLWGLGPAWGVMAIVGTGWSLLRRAHDKEHVAARRIVLLWSPLLFLFHATQFAATLRYFLPIIPPWRSPPAGRWRTRPPGVRERGCLRRCLVRRLCGASPSA